MPACKSMSFRQKMGKTKTARIIQGPIWDKNLFPKVKGKYALLTYPSTDDRYLPRNLGKDKYWDDNTYKEISSQLTVAKKQDKSKCKEAYSDLKNKATIKWFNDFTKVQNEYIKILKKDGVSVTELVSGKPSGDD